MERSRGNLRRLDDRALCKCQDGFHNDHAVFLVLLAAGGANDLESTPSSRDRVLSKNPKDLVLL